MTARVQLRMGDFVAVHIVLSAAAVELGMRELYHRFAAETLSMGALAALWIVVSAVAVMGVAGLSARFRPLICRTVLLIAFGGCAWVLFGDGIFKAVGGRFGSAYVPIAGMLLALAIAAWISRLEAAQWATARRAIVAGCVLFVAVQPALVAFLAPTLSWPPAGGSAAERPAGTRSSTVFLLLDELNATSAVPFAALLEQRGLRVKTKLLTPVGDGTAQFIPAMFTGLRFEDPKPCSPSSVCSGQNILDFGRIIASRSDIDVVGFSQPYCSIRGLRYCERVPVALAAFDLDRWRCAAWRRTGFPRDTSIADCEPVYNRAWAEMVRGTVAALGRAPIWTQGGFLFAHLPLPHPPGSTPGASLQTHYQENLGRALEVVAGIVARARQAPGDQLRIVIFSDHPLRQEMWCKSHLPYTLNHCVAVDALNDTQVPLIVAGNGELPALDGIAANDQVFKVAATWR